MIERLTNRPSIYGSPFKNSDSGRLEYDPVNKAKL